jgi:uncharacterized protein YdaL
MIHSHNKPASITTVGVPKKDGNLYSTEEHRSITGFDLDAILNSADKPDIINIELIWQQWASRFNDTTTFSPRWTEQAVRQTELQVKDRADLVIHLELTSFRRCDVTTEQFCESVRSAYDGGGRGIDFYDTHLADTMGIWPQIGKVLNYVATRKVTIYHDQDEENDARQLKLLLRHFHTETSLIPVGENFSASDTPEADVIFYVGVVHRESLPSEFVRHLSRTKKTVCWVNYNLECLGEEKHSELGFQYKGLDDSSAYQVLYKGITFPKIDSMLNIVHIRDPNRCHTLATAQSGEHEFPYIVRSGRFWYVTDLPTNYMTEGGRHIAFADLLHDILGEDHEEKHLALVRIEDVNPGSDPESLREIADLLKSKKIPFSVGFTPFYLDPSTNTAFSISDRPELLNALHHMVSKGGTIILHGCTHQYRGQSTVDYEFWDGLTDQPIFEDSEEYVGSRIKKALDECFLNDIYPLVWETPHYAASLLDYRVIDRYFSTSYERRQTMDILGTDLLLPFFIPADSSENQIIPENLGYVPADAPSPEDIISGARRNLAVRDGFASFFFHPFVKLDALKHAVEQIQAMGYSFANIRSVNNRVVTSSNAVISGKAKISVNVQDQYLKEFYITSKGKIKSHYTSEETLSSRVTKEVACPQNWMYVARTLDEKKPGFPSNIWASISKSSLLAGQLWQPQPLNGVNTPVVPLFLIDTNAQGNLSVDQMSLLNAFESVGIDNQTIPVSDFLEIPEGINLVVLPYAAGRYLSEQQILFLMSAVSRGMNIILENETSLSTRMGIRPTGDELSVSAIRDEYYPQVDIHWKEEDTYRDFDVDIEYVTYYSERNTDNPIVIGGEYGEGKYLYFATLFDPTTSKGYGRYPYYCDLVQRQFGLWPTLRREHTEIYFEPADREDVSIEELIKLWKEHGIRTIYVASWHVYPEWTYEYDYLIKLAHENAMLVYLWLELPHVNDTFWEDHPEWREKTALGDEAVVDWRNLMALTDESCREAVFSEISSLIQEYDWDGINLAELYFESPFGPERPELYTPMHPSVRASFQTQHGFDPIKLFNSNSPYYWKRNIKKWRLFEEFRKDMIVQLHKEFLTFFHQQNEQKEKSMEIVVTALDNILAKKTGEGTATDTKKLIELAEELPFTLQIEDPQELWHLGPFRYDSLSQTYHAMLPEKNLIFDINVIPYRSFEKSQAPTRQPTGLELYDFLQSALQDKNRVALYSESSIYSVDLPWLAYTLGRNTKENFSSFKWEIQSDYTVTLDLNAEEHNDIRVNGNLWPAYYKGKVILPPGSHSIQPVSRIDSWRNVLRTTARLADISGELKSCRTLSRGMEISYDSPVRNYIIINEEPQEILVDGEQYHSEFLYNNTNVSLELPAGSHTVKIYTRSSGALSVSNFSIIASALIILTSIIAGLVLFVLYVRGLRRRKRSHKIEAPQDRINLEISK